MNTPGSAIFYTKGLLGGLAVYFMLLCFRGICRASNPEYVTFINYHSDAVLELNYASNVELMKYTFDDRWLPVYSLKDHRNLSKWVDVPRRETWYCTYITPISYILAHTIGIKLSYPGTLSFIQQSTLSFRVQARNELASQYGLERVGLVTRFSEFVDALQADRRNANDPDSIGNKLFICCEGNAGYPEIGTINVPLKVGYSILGWNHPGFGSSTGLPFPKHEKAAVEALYMYATDELKFRPQDIYFLGWSIGGYTVTWAAMNYPKIAGIILDATFDNIDELARGVMPAIFYPLVLSTVRQHLDLNNLDQLKRFSGPVFIIRRSHDEIICSRERTRSSNRGNVLLMELLRQRFPNLFEIEAETALMKYLEHSPADNRNQRLFESFSINEVTCQDEIDQFFSTNSKFPSQFGNGFEAKKKAAMLLYLARKYFAESKGSHCSPLDEEVFRLPWSERDNSQ
ncbi:hypothetical protein Ciccas_002622 [Cichlidogyrus casuarinus]|uniref:AB hydrolase-1 domain-containing protein n=1 Tax=Cichlidogyrus casuarinus TaxID=1844966 RepID=A0ABD2QGQ5_9PLAT